MRKCEQAHGFEMPGGAPVREAGVGLVPSSEALRQIAPRAAGASPEGDRFEELASGVPMQGPREHGLDKAPSFV